MHGFTEESEPGIDSVDECKSACVRSSSCVAIDFDATHPFGHYCWLLTDTATDQAHGVVHYVLDRNCTGLIQVRSVIAVRYAEVFPAYML